MQIGRAHQPTEVACILGDDHAVFRQAPYQHAMIRLTAAAKMQRVNRVVLSGCIEPRGEQRREAFVDEQSYDRAQGRPFGRPSSGCVRA